MECQNKGLLHLGLSSEACENAGGHWYKCMLNSTCNSVYLLLLTCLIFSLAPCYLLKECINDRPVELGYCIDNEDRQCRDDTDCFVKGTGTCNGDPLWSQTGKSCTSNETCTNRGSSCVNITEDIQTKCSINIGSFEEWVLSFAIEDPYDAEECEHARVELGFEADELDDALVCEQFDALKCDPDSIFDDIDHLTSTARFSPSSTTPVKYEPVT